MAAAVCVPSANHSLKLRKVRTSVGSAAHHSPESVFLLAMTIRELMPSTIANSAGAVQHFVAHMINRRQRRLQ
jgi:hypothetical protein